MNEQTRNELKELFDLCLALNELSESETFFEICLSSNVAHIRICTPDWRLDIRGKSYIYDLPYRQDNKFEDIKTELKKVIKEALSKKYYQNRKYKELSEQFGFNLED